MFRFLGFVVVSFLFACSSHTSQAAVEKSSIKNLKNHIDALVLDEKFRNYEDIKELNRVAAYIKSEIEKSGVPCSYQEYSVDESNAGIYKNVVCKLDVGKAKTFIVGAHYDVCGDQEGADDNASGVAGLIESARILSLHRKRLKENIEFVAYTLEEPPFFRTELMGSYVHAHNISSKEMKKYSGMISLEMIGFFSEENIQEYPMGLGLLYPSHGNFIASVGNLSSNWISSRFKKSMKQLKGLSVERLVAPSFVAGVDFSDHLNYWDIGMDAVMITDTAFMRNKNYHQTSDKIDTLNFSKMSEVVNGVTHMFLNE